MTHFFLKLLLILATSFAFSDVHNNLNAPDLDKEISQDFDSEQPALALKEDLKKDQSGKPKSMGIKADPSGCSNTVIPISSFQKKEKENSLSTYWQHPYFIEARGAYFLFTESRLKQYYSPAPLWGLEFDGQIYRYLYGWTAVSYLTANGKTTPDHKSTTLSLVPLSAGLKCIYTNYLVQPYAGIGIEALYGKEKTDSPVLANNRQNWGCGGIFKVGFLTYFTQYIFLDFYTDYSIQKLHLKTLGPSKPQIEFVNSADLSGFSFGMSLGGGF